MKIKPTGLLTTWVLLPAVRNLNLTHILNAHEHHNYKFSIAGPEATELSKQGWDIPKPLCCQDLKLPRTIYYWVTTTHELPLLLRPHLTRHQDHPLEPLLISSVSVFSFPGKMIFKFSFKFYFLT